MSKGDGSARANLRATRAQMNNASASAQTRAFKARQVAKQKRDAEERKLRAAQAAAKAAKAAKEANVAATATSPVLSTGTMPDKRVSDEGYRPCLRCDGTGQCLPCGGGPGGCEECSRHPGACIRCDGEGQIREDETAEAIERGVDGSGGRAR